MSNEVNQDRVIDLLDASMKVVEAALDYEAILSKPRGTVEEKVFKAILRRLFTEAHRVMAMRLKNLQDAVASSDDDHEYKEFLRRN